MYSITNQMEFEVSTQTNDMRSYNCQFRPAWLFIENKLQLKWRGRCTTANVFVRIQCFVVFLKIGTINEIYWRWKIWLPEIYMICSERVNYCTNSWINFICPFSIFSAIKTIYLKHFLLNICDKTKIEIPSYLGSKNLKSYFKFVCEYHDQINWIKFQLTCYFALVSWSKKFCMC